MLIDRNATFRTLCMVKAKEHYIVKRKLRPRLYGEKLSRVEGSPA